MLAKLAMENATMSQGVFNEVQLSAIKEAADRVEEILGVVKEKDKLVVARAVFDLAAEIDLFDTEKLVELARERLTPARGWQFRK